MAIRFYTFPKSNIDVLLVKIFEIRRKELFDYLQTNGSTTLAIIIDDAQFNGLSKLIILSCL